MWQPFSSSVTWAGIGFKGLGDSVVLDQRSNSQTLLPENPINPIQPISP